MFFLVMTDRICPEEPAGCVICRPVRIFFCALSSRVDSLRNSPSPFRRQIDRLLPPHLSNFFPITN